MAASAIGINDEEKLIGKVINAHTKSIIEKLADTNILPKFKIIPHVRIEYETESRYILNMEKYPMTYGQYMDKIWDNIKLSKTNLNEWEEKIIILINKMHDCRILHRDLIADNIIINPETGDVRLIDFDNAETFEEFNIRIAKKAAEYGPRIKNLEEAKQSDRTVWCDEFNKI